MFPLQLFGSLALGVSMIAALFAPNSDFLPATFITAGKLLLILATMGLVWAVSLPARDQKGLLIVVPGTAAFVLVFTALGVALKMLLAVFWKRQLNWHASHLSD